MKITEQAIQAELNLNYVQAVNLYEKAIKLNHNEIDSYINLAFLYWTFALDENFNRYYNIPDKLSILGGNRFNIILDLAIQKFPNSVELYFWKKYFNSILNGIDFTQKNCESLINLYGKNSLVPYFFLSLFDTENYIIEVEQLKLICNNELIAKNEYIISILSRNLKSNFQNNR